MLIEYGTGIYTGSVYNDSTLVSLLPGEAVCDTSVSAIKIHPHTHGFRYGENALVAGIASEGNLCSKGGVTSVKKVIFVVRDPYDAIWSEHQRRLTSGNHAGKIEVEDFDISSWYSHTTLLAKVYAEMWVHYDDMLRSLGSENTFLVKYEDLKVDKQILNKVLTFIGRNNISDRRLDCSFQVSPIYIYNFERHSLCII